MFGPRKRGVRASRLIFVFLAGFLISSELAAAPRHAGPATTDDSSPSSMEAFDNSASSGSKYDQVSPRTLPPMGILRELTPFAAIIQKARAIFASKSPEEQSRLRALLLMAPSGKRRREETSLTVLRMLALSGATSGVLSTELASLKGVVKKHLGVAPGSGWQLRLALLAALPTPKNNKKPVPNPSASAQALALLQKSFDDRLNRFAGLGQGQSPYGNSPAAQQRDAQKDSSSGAKGAQNNRPQSGAHGNEDSPGPRSGSGGSGMGFPFGFGGFPGWGGQGGQSGNGSGKPSSGSSTASGNSSSASSPVSAPDTSLSSNDSPAPKLRPLPGLSPSAKPSMSNSGANSEAASGAPNIASLLGGRRGGGMGLGAGAPFAGGRLAAPLAPPYASFFRGGAPAGGYVAAGTSSRGASLAGFDDAVFRSVGAEGPEPMGGPYNFERMSPSDYGTPIGGESSDVTGDSGADDSRKTSSKGAYAGFLQMGAPSSDPSDNGIFARLRVARLCALPVSKRIAVCARDVEGISRQTGR